MSVETVLFLICVGLAFMVTCLIGAAYAIDNDRHRSEEA